MAMLPQAISYEDYLKSWHWKKTRETRIRITQLAHPCDLPGLIYCSRCERFVWEGAVNVHHKNYGCLWREKISDLEVICRGCHAEHHGKPLPLWFIKARSLELRTITKGFVLQSRVIDQFTPIGKVMDEVLRNHWFALNCKRPDLSELSDRF